MQEYVIDGVKVIIERETNINSKSVIDCLLELFFLREKEKEEECLNELEDKEE